MLIRRLPATVILKGGLTEILAPERLALLVVSRKIGEKLLIGDSVAITVVKVAGGGVRLGVEAPPEMAVTRQELAEQIEERATPRRAGRGGPLKRAYFRHLVADVCLLGGPRLDLHAWRTDVDRRRRTVATQRAVCLDESDKSGQLIPETPAHLAGLRTGRRPTPRVCLLG